MTVSPDLNEASAFLHGDADGYISICGYGSLLSEKSARATFPQLTNFRIARLTGFRRLFSIVGAFFFTRGIANLKTEEIAGLSVEPCEGETIIVTVFDIKKTEIPAFIEREREYRFLAVVPESLDGEPFTNPAVLCASYTDEEFFKFRCSGCWKEFPDFKEPLIGLTKTVAKEYALAVASRLLSNIYAFLPDNIS